jgi:glycosyltransferase involved in cell wall biosynthesis
MKIVFIAFNCGNAGRYVNGPGICLFNFLNILKTQDDLEIDVFTQLESSLMHAESTKNIGLLFKKIKDADIVHWWSGISEESIRIIQKANSYNKKIIIGPNLLDGVKSSEEIKLLRQIKFDKLLTVNFKLQYDLSSKYKIDMEKTDILMIGPDIKLWECGGDKNNKILWKGNSSQFVKDVDFAIKVSEKVSLYGHKVDFIGHPQPYDYLQHIDEAKKYSLYFSSSLSETMGMALAEQWAASTPSVTHPKVYLHGENYVTGIITNRDIQSYVDAIREIVENKMLQKDLSDGAKAYAEKIFNSKIIISNYYKIITEI